MRDTLPRMTSPDTADTYDAAGIDGDPYDRPTQDPKVDDPWVDLTDADGYFPCGCHELLYKHECGR